MDPLRPQTRLRRRVRGGLGAALVVAVLLGGLPAGAVASQSVAVSVDDAEARVSALVDERASAESRLASAEDELAAVTARLDELSGRSRDVVDQMGKAQQQASRLAVDAYVQGSNDDELRTLDASTATAAALRMHLTTGRLDQAREAAAQLLSLRGEVDAELVDLSVTVAQLRQGVADAQQDLAGIIAAELYAASQLDEARAEADRAAAAEAEREATARAQAAEANRAAASAAGEEQAAQARADEEPAPVTSSASSSSSSPGSSSPGSSSSGSSAALPSVPVQTDGWEQLRQCESGGNYQSRSNSLYRGAYQFGYSTWESVGGTGDPADAPPAEQDARAYALYLLRGASPWPECGRYLL